MNDRFLPGSIAIAVAILALIAMYVSWRRRGRRDAGLRPITSIPERAGALLATIGGFYVATTVHGRAVERLAVPGLGFRSRADLEVFESGLVIAIPGQERIFLPSPSIERVARATWAIDRVVERDGLVLVSWAVPTVAGGTGDAASPAAESATTPSATTVDSYFRIVDHGDSVRFFEAIHRIAPGAGAQTPAESEV